MPTARGLAWLAALACFRQWPAWLTAVTQPSPVPGFRGLFGCGRCKTSPTRLCGRRSRNAAFAQIHSKWGGAKNGGKKPQRHVILDETHRWQADACSRRFNGSAMAARGNENRLMRRSYCAIRQGTVGCSRKAGEGIRARRARLSSSFANRIALPWFAEQQGVRI